MWQPILDWPIRHTSKLLARACFGRFWLDFGSILAIFLAVVCNSIHPLASIPAFAMPEAEDQVQNLTFTSGSTIYPSSITSDSAPQSDSYPAATISSSTASMLLPQPPRRHRPISAHAPNLAFCSTLLSTQSWRVSFWLLMVLYFVLGRRMLNWIIDIVSRGRSQSASASSSDMPLPAVPRSSSLYTLESSIVWSVITVIWWCVPWSSGLQHSKQCTIAKSSLS